MVIVDHGQDAQPLDPAAQAPDATVAAHGRDALDDRDPDWWSESTDGRCSESAALFAESQPAPLTIV